MRTLSNSLMISGFVALAMILCLNPISQVAGAKKEIELTSTMVAWVSSQCESIIEELEAIVQQNAQTLRFNVVNYLRYLYLYDSLKVVGRQKVKELKWVAAKARAFEQVYQYVEDALYEYLGELDKRLALFEGMEGKSKQKGVGYFWRVLYETIDYIAHYSPKDSRLQTYGLELLQVSPNGTADKRRSIRYEIATSGSARR